MTRTPAHLDRAASTAAAARAVGKSASTLRLYAWLLTTDDPGDAHRSSWEHVHNPEHPFPAPTRQGTRNTWDVPELVAWFLAHGRRAPVKRAPGMVAHVLPRGLVSTEDLADITGRATSTLRHYASVSRRPSPTEAMAYTWNSLRDPADPMPIPTRVGRTLAWDRALMVGWFERRSQHKAGRPLASASATITEENAR